MKPSLACCAVLLAFAVLAPTARLLGYKGSYPEYLKREPSEMLEVEPWAIP